MHTHVYMQTFDYIQSELYSFVLLSDSIMILSHFPLAAIALLRGASRLRLNPLLGTSVLSLNSRRGLWKLAFCIDSRILSFIIIHRKQSWTIFIIQIIPIVMQANFHQFKGGLLSFGWYVHFAMTHVMDAVSRHAPTMTHSFVFIESSRFIDILMMVWAL